MENPPHGDFSKTNKSWTPSVKFQQFKQLSGRHLKIIALVVVVVVFIIILSLAIALGVANGKLASVKDNKTPDKDECTTQGCVLAASEILGALDTTVDPCDDMFQFSCGNWLTTHPDNLGEVGKFISNGEQIHLQVKDLLETRKATAEIQAFGVARNFYAACMNKEQIETERLTTLQTLLVELGGWPVLGTAPGGNWRSDSYDLPNLLVNVYSNTLKTPLIQTSVAPNYITQKEHIIAQIYYYHPLIDKSPQGTNANTCTENRIHDLLITLSGDISVARFELCDKEKKSHFVPNVSFLLIVTQPPLGMPARSYYLQGWNDVTLQTYKTTAVQVAIAAGASEQTAREDMTDMMHLEIALANITLPTEKTSQFTGQYRVMTLRGLASAFPQFDSSRYMRSLFGISGVDITLTDQQTVVLFDGEYYNRLSGVLNKFSTRTITNYVIWHVVKEFTYLLPESFQEFGFDFEKALYGKEFQTPRWTRCVGATASFLPSVVGRMYIDNYFQNSSKSNMELLVKELENAFKELLENAEWMDTPTRANALNKLDKMKLRLGYPDSYLNNAILNAVASRVSVDSNNPLKNLWNFAKVYAVLSLSYLLDPVDKDGWIPQAAATVYNALYDPTSNSMYFPAAFVQPPLYREDMPMYTKLGGIGFVIGHEMTHGFDTTGRKYDEEGKYVDWWTAESARKYSQRAQCIIEQYSKFQEPQTRLFLNGNLTVGENIADNGGLKESFLAYRNWVKRNGAEKKLPGINYSTEQLFFISAAQLWCSKVSPEYAKFLIHAGTHSLNQFRKLLGAWSLFIQQVSEYILDIVKRVIGEMRNSPEFSEVFSCPAGSPMNPTKKCTVW